MAPTVRTAVLAPEGASVANDFQEKDVAVRCWTATLAHAGVDDKVLADECGMSRGYFSKISSGQQGDLLNLIYLVGRRRPELRREFVARLAEQEDTDLLTQAAEQLTSAAIRFLRLRGIVLPAAPLKMAKADRARPAVA
jgi:hypothetical protein